MLGAGGSRRENGGDYNDLDPAGWVLGRLGFPSGWPGSLAPD